MLRRRVLLGACAIVGSCAIFLWNDQATAVAGKTADSRANVVRVKPPSPSFIERQQRAIKAPCGEIRNWKRPPIANPQR